MEGGRRETERQRVGGRHKETQEGGERDTEGGKERQRDRRGERQTYRRETDGETGGKRQRDRRKRDRKMAALTPLTGQFRALAPWPQRHRRM